MLDVSANIATIVTAVSGLGLICYARWMTLHHLLAHVVMIRNWVVGPAKAGWSKESITPAIVLTWRHPRRRQIPQYSAGPLSQIMLSQNFFVSKSLIDRVVVVAQMIETFNDSIAQYNAFNLRCRQGWQEGR